MGLVDLLRRVLDAFDPPPENAPAPPLTAPPVQPAELLEEWKARARLEGELEAVKAEWAGYKDTFTKLAQRLEKREQRAAARESNAQSEDEGTPEGFDEVEGYRALRERRQASALLRSR